MSFWKTLVKVGLPIAGAIFGGPLGGLIAGAIAGHSYGGGTQGMLRGGVLGGIGGALPGLMQSAGGLMSGLGGTTGAGALGAAGAAEAGLGAGAATLGEEALAPSILEAAGGGVAQAAPVATSALPVGTDLGTLAAGGGGEALGAGAAGAGGANLGGAPAAFEQSLSTPINNPSAFTAQPTPGAEALASGGAGAEDLIAAGTPGGVGGAADVAFGAQQFGPVAQGPFTANPGGFGGPNSFFQGDLFPYRSGTPLEEAYSRYLNSPAGAMMRTAGGYLGKAEPFLRTYQGIQGLRTANELRQLSRLPSSDVTKLPGYEAGLEAVRRSMASQGFQGSGNMLTALQRYGGDAYDQAVRQRLAASQYGAGPATMTATSLAALGSGLKGMFA